MRKELPSGEFDADRHGHYHFIARPGELAPGRVDQEGHDIVRILVRRKQELPTRSDLEPARLIPATGDMVQDSQLATLRVDRETGKAVMPAVGGVQVFAIWGDMDIGKRITAIIAAR